MADVQNVVVPDLGGADDVDVIEVLVKPGDTVNEEDSLVRAELRIRRSPELETGPATNCIVILNTHNSHRVFDRFGI